MFKTIYSQRGHCIATESSRYDNDVWSETSTNISAPGSHKLPATAFHEEPGATQQPSDAAFFIFEDQGLLQIENLG